MGIRGPQNYLFRLHAPVWWIVALCAIAIPAYAATIMVTNTNDSGLGSLRHALAIANDGDAVTFVVTGSIVLTTGELLVNKSITISGPRAANLVVDGNASSRVFHIASDQTVSIARLIVRNGNATANDGGGIYNDHAALTLDNCTITANLAGYGGGIYNDGLDGSATLEISNSNIHDNIATHTGGSICNDGGESGNASLTISNSALNGNSAPFGGGIYNDGFDGGDAMLTVNNSTCTGNSADFGGCIFNEAGSLGSASLTLNDSTLSGNTAHSAGGSIYNDMVNGFGTQTLNNSTLRGNSAGKSGGAIYNDQGQSFTINNCVISGNSAQEGGGIYNDGYQGAAWLTINSSTLSGNSAAVGGGIFNDGEQHGVTRLQISNSTFSGNTASYGGGLASNGFNAYYVRVTIGNSTFTSNSASSAGGGIYNATSLEASSAEPACRAANRLSDCEGIVRRGGGGRDKATVRNDAVATTSSGTSPTLLIATAMASRRLNSCFTPSFSRRRTRSSVIASEPSVPVAFRPLSVIRSSSSSSSAGNESRSPRTSLQTCLAKLSYASGAPSAAVITSGSRDAARS